LQRLLNELSVLPETEVMLLAHLTAARQARVLCDEGTLSLNEGGQYAGQLERRLNEVVRQDAEALRDKRR
jgi:hypothetical protein